MLLPLGEGCDDADGPLPVIVVTLVFALFLQAFGVHLNGVNLFLLRAIYRRT
jgi:hypothetical protein